MYSVVGGLGPGVTQDERCDAVVTTGQPELQARNRIVNPSWRPSQVQVGSSLTQSRRFFFV
jgi:hypothetical protein